MPTYVAITCAALFTELSCLPPCPPPLYRWANSRFSGLAGGFQAGSITTAGDDTNFNDASYTNRAITGGTGGFTGNDTNREHQRLSAYCFLACTCHSFL